MTEISDIFSDNCTDTVYAGENKQRLTRRNYYGQPFVPGYAPKCDDPQTCELIVELTNRLADLEDLLEANPESKKEGAMIIERKSH